MFGEKNNKILLQKKFVKNICYKFKENNKNNNKWRKILQK